MTHGLAEGSEESFLRLYDQHANEMFAFFVYRISDREEAEDLTQMLFERALTSWHRYDPRRTKPITWLVAIARNMLIDRHRRRSARPDSFSADAELLEEALPPAAGPEQSSRRTGLDPDVERALAGLSDRERELLALRYGADLTGAEIAELTGLSLANVQQILSRSLRRLREDLDAMSGASEAPRA